MMERGLMGAYARAARASHIQRAWPRPDSLRAGIFLLRTAPARAVLEPEDRKGDLTNGNEEDNMNRTSLFSASVLLALGAALLPGNVVGQRPY